MDSFTAQQKYYLTKPVSSSRTISARSQERMHAGRHVDHRHVGLHVHHSNLQRFSTIVELMVNHNLDDLSDVFIQGGEIRFNRSDFSYDQQK